MSTNGDGAGASVEAAAAGARAASGGRVVRDPELVEQAKRRTFTAGFKARILAEADACTAPGEVGELLRREGLYTSHLTYWRKQRKDGALRSSASRAGVSRSTGAMRRSWRWSASSSARRASWRR